MSAGFDRVARVYRWAEYLALGTLLQRTRTGLLAQVADCRRAVLFGDGDGRFLLELLKQNGALEATAVDSSTRMLELLAARCAAFADRVRVVEDDLLCVEVPAGTDLLVTHFVMDCLSDEACRAFAERLFARTAPGTRWLVSDFAPVRSRWLRPLSEAYIRALYVAFRVLTGLEVQRLPAIGEALKAAGWRRLLREERAGGFVYTEMWERP